MTALGNWFVATKLFTVCGYLCWAWVAMGRTRLYTKAGFHQLQIKGKVSNRPKAPQGPFFPCLYLSAAYYVQSHKIPWQCSSCMKKGLSESLSRGDWLLPDWYRFKFYASAESEATQQKFQYIPRLAATHQVSANHCGRVGWGNHQGEAIEFIRPKSTKIWLCEGRT